MDINKNLTLVNYIKGNNKKNEYIVIHYTANNGDTALGNTKYFKNEYRGASAHYFVDENYIYQCVEDNDIAWHVGAKKYKHPYCRNDNSIGIEMCSRKDENGNYYIKEEVIKKTVELVKELINKYNIPLENILTHFLVSGKKCPAPFVDNPDKWIQFLDDIKQNEEVLEVVTYKSLEDIPKWFRNDIKELIDNGIIKGNGEDLGLTEQDVKSAVISKRICEHYINK